MSDTIPPDVHKEVKKTVLELDLVAYNDVARFLEENLNVEAVKAFQDQIQNFVDHGLDAVGLRREDVVLGTSGDNAVLIFDDAETMHRFAQAVQNETLAYNNQKSIEAAKRWFRMGAATGMVLSLPSQKQIVGTTISRSVRLEAAASKGELLVDLPTFQTLPDELKKYYGAEETIQGKRQEIFQARRCRFIDIPADSSQVQQSPFVAVTRKLRGGLLGILSIGIITLTVGGAILYLRERSNSLASLEDAGIRRGLFESKERLAVSGYLVASCRECGRPRAWAFYVPPSGSFDKWPIEFRRNPWPLKEFLYPDDKPGGSRCVDFPEHVCDAEFTEYDRWKPTHPLVGQRPHTPSLSLALRVANSGYELEITNVGDILAQNVAVEALAWQVTSPGIDFHKNYSVGDLGSFAEAIIPKIFEDGIPLNTGARQR
jgi:class 3 adenylate cyclase